MVQSVANQDLLIKAQVLDAVQQIGLAKSPQALLDALSDAPIIKEADRAIFCLFEDSETEPQSVARIVAQLDSRPNVVDRKGFVMTPQQFPLLWSGDIPDPLLVEDITQTSHLDSASRQLLEQVGVQSLASFAIQTSDKRLGWLVLEYEKVRSFSPAEVSFFQILTQQIAIILHNQHLAQEADRRAQDLGSERDLLNALYHFTDRLDSATSIDTLLDILVEFNATIRATRHLIYLLEDVGTEHLRASHDFSVQPIFKKIRRTIKEVAFIPDTQQDAAWVEIVKLFGDIDLASVICIPLELHQGRAQGFILFGHERGNAFSAQLLGQVKSTGAQFSLALKNLLASEDAANAIHEAQVLVTASRMLTASVELADVYKTMNQAFLSTGGDKALLGIYHLDDNQQPAELELVDIAGPQATSISADILGVRQPLVNFDMPYLRTCFETGRIITIDDVVNDPKLNPIEKTSLANMGAQAVAAIPIISKGLPFGFVLVGYEQAHPYSDREVSLFRTIANQTTLVVEHAQQLAAAEQRARQVQTGAEISKTASTILNHESLIDRSVNLIRDGFNYYYVGLFLLDDKAEWAVLQAGTGEEGKAQIALGHKLALSEQSMIGRCIIQKQACMDFDVGEGSQHFRNPHLPLTRSEMALPLISRGVVIGALSIQSKEPRAFSQDDILTLQIMADQIANAISNSTLFQKTQQTAQELEVLYQMSRSIAAANTVEEAIALTVELMPKAFFDRIAFALREDPDDPNNTWVEIAGLWDRDTPSPSGLHQRFSGERFPFLLEVLNRDMFMVNDIVTAPELDEQSRQVLLAVQAKSMALITVRAGQRVLGLLLAETRQPHNFIEADLQPLLSAADQAATTIDRIHKTESLLKAGQQYLAMIDNIPGAVSQGEIINGRYVLSFISDDIVDISGYPVEDFLDENRSLIREIVHPDDRAQAEAELAAQAAERGSFQVNQRIVTATGQIKYVAVHGRATLDEKGNIHNIDSIMFDRTERQKLQEAVAHRAAQFEAVAQVSESISAILDVDRLLTETAELITERFGFYYAGIFLLDAEQKQAILRAGSGEAGQRMLDLEHKLPRDENSMVGWATYHSQARIALDVGVEARRFDNPHLPLTRSEIALPLIARRNVIGALDVQSTEPNAFTEDDIATLQLMANQLANAIDNARLFEQRQQRLREQAALAEVARVASSTLDSRQIFQTTAEEMAKLFDIERCNVFIHDDTYNYLQVVASFPNQADTDRVIPVTNGLLNPTRLQTKQPILTQNEQYTQMLGQDVHQVAFFPIYVIDKFRGLIGIGSADPALKFEAEDLALGETLANQVGVSLEKAELFFTIREREQSLASMHEIGQIASSSLDLKKMLSEVSAYLVETFKVNHCIFLMAEANNLGRIIAEYPKAGAEDKTILLGTAPFEQEWMVERKTVIVEDVIADTRLGTFRDQFVNSLNLKSFLIIPLHLRTKLIGAFQLNVNTEVRRFTPQEISLAEAIANTLAVSISNAQLFETTEQNLQEANLLYQASQQMIKAGNEEELFTLFIQRAAEIEADSVSLSLIHGEGQDRVLTIKNIWSLEETGYQEGAQYLLRDFILAPLVDVAETTVVAQVETDEKLTEPLRQALLAQGFYSIIAIPILVQYKAVGVVHVTCRSANRAFTHNQVRLIESLVHELTIIWQNLNLLASIEKRLRRERIIREVTSKIHAATGVDHVLQTTVTELSKAFDAPQGIARLHVNSTGSTLPAHGIITDHHEHKND